jgi:hypothetical protein
MTTDRNNLDYSLHPRYGNASMPKGSERLKPVAFRIPPTVAEKLKVFLKKYGSRPHYISSHRFAEEAIIREMERLEAEFNEDKSDPIINRINNSLLHR